MRNTFYLSIVRLEISCFLKFLGGFDDILPFFADEYTVYDFQTFGEIVESQKYRLEYQLEYNQLEYNTAKTPKFNKYFR